MRIVGSFTIVREALYALRYDTENYESEEESEFTRLFNTWDDANYLDDFFQENIDDLNTPIWGGVSIDEAIAVTIKQARELERKMYKVAKDGKMDHANNLSGFFQPLTNASFQKFEKNKAYGLAHRSWLRIYALRIQPNLFVVTGGGIKLTRRMDECEHLRRELAKLEQAKKLFVNDDLDSFELIENLTL